MRDAQNVKTPPGSATPVPAREARAEVPGRRVVEINITNRAPPPRRPRRQDPVFNRPGVLIIAQPHRHAPVRRSE